MRRWMPAVILAFCLAAPAVAQDAPAIGHYLGPAYPYELVSAAKADRIGWLAYERGQRNVYTAAAPDFRPVRLTRFLEDDGIDLTTLSISADGSVVVFVRGHTPNRNGWVANVTSDPAGAERAIWAARTAGGPPWRLAEGTAPVVSPDGRYAAYAKDGQIYRVRVTQGAGGALPDGQGRGAAGQGVGHEQRPGLVARRFEDRVRQRPRRPQLHRRVRPQEPDGDVHGPGRGPRHEPHLVARRPADRVHPPAGHAVRHAGAAGQRGHRQPARAGRRHGWRGARPAGRRPARRDGGDRAGRPGWGARPVSGRRSPAATRSRSGWRTPSRARRASSGTTSPTTGHSRTSTPSSGLAITSSSRPSRRSGFATTRSASRAAPRRPSS